MKQTLDFLKKAGLYYIATIDGDKPRLRPFGTINLYNGRLYIQTSSKKLVAKQIEEHPWVEISAMHDGKWIRVSAKLVLDESLTAKKSMLDAYPELRGMYNENDDKTTVYYLTEVTSTIYSFTADPITETF